MSLNVLHVVPSLGPLRGGPSFSVPTMAHGLAQAGLNVHIATTDDNGNGHLDVPLGHPIVRSGVTYWYFRRQTSFYTTSWPLTHWLTMHVSRYDIVHIHALFSYSSLLAALCANGLYVPYIVRPLGSLNQWGLQQRRPWLKKLSLQLIERHMLTRAAAVHFTSEQERRQAEASSIPMHSMVIPLGVDVEPFAHLPARGSLRNQYPQLANKTLLLCLARLDPIKGLDLLLPAFAQLYHKQPTVALILAGRGTDAYEAQLKLWTQELGIESAVVFTGFLNHEQKRAALADGDLFVLASYFESFGLSIVEAMSSGLPVIISDQVGIAHEVAQAHAGIVVPCQQDRLTDAMCTLVNNITLRNQLGYNAQKLVHQHFSLAAVNKMLIQTYHSLLLSRQELNTA